MKRPLFIALLLLARAFGQDRTAPIVSIDFDDGYRSAYEHALPILDKAGMRSGQFIVTGVLGQPGYVTKENVLDMERRGHEIGAHTRTHPHLSGMGSSDQRIEINGSKLDLEILLDHPVKNFCYPFGSYDENTQRIVREAGFQNARTVNWGNTSQGTNPFLLPVAKDITPKTTLADLQRWIEDAGRGPKQTWVILVFHRFDEQGEMSISSEVFQQIVDYLVQRKIKVMTHSEALWYLRID
jgi:peptidoglycan/xylan/chitin deacetylase (PgdA/CDA1 family)